VDPAEALKRARIAPQQIQVPDAHITAEQMETFSEAAMHQLADEALGWFSIP